MWCSHSQLTAIKTKLRQMRRLLNQLACCKMPMCRACNPPHCTIVWSGNQHVFCWSNMAGNDSEEHALHCLQQVVGQYTRPVHNFCKEMQNMHSLLLDSLLRCTPFIHLISNFIVDHIEIVSINSLLFVTDAYWWKCDAFNIIWYVMSNKVQFCQQTTGTKSKCIYWVYIKVINHKIWNPMLKMSMNPPL